MSPTEELRAAASKLRANNFALLMELACPGLAEPLAASLEESARTAGGHQQMADYAGLPDHRWCLGCQDEECEGLMALDKALDVARSINGTAGTES